MSRYADEAERIERAIVALEVRRLEMIQGGYYRPVIDGIDNDIANKRRTAKALREAAALG